MAALGAHLSPTVIMRQHESMLESGAYYDMVLVCDGREFYLHQNVICLRSPFMKELCASAPKVHGIVRTFLPDTDTIALEKVLEYIYTGTYDHLYEHRFSKELLCKSKTEIASASPSADCSTTLIDLDFNDNPAQKYSLRSYSGLFSYDSRDLVIMHLNARMYIIAVFMCNQDLKNEASKRFKDVLYGSFIMIKRDRKVLPIIQEVLQNIDHDDTGLRLDFVDHSVRYTCGEHEWKELAEIFEEYEPIALHVARHMSLPVDTSTSAGGSGTAQRRGSAHQQTKPGKAAVSKDNQIQILKGLLASAQSALEETKKAQFDDKGKTSDTVKAKDGELKTLRKQLSETSKKLNSTEKQLSDKSTELVLLRKGNDKPDHDGRAFINNLTYEWDMCRGKGCNASFDGYVAFEGDNKQPVLLCKYCHAKHKKVPPPK